MTESHSTKAHEVYSELHRKLGESIKGQEETLHHILACYFTGHHVLLEDFPGTGKTTLAKRLAELLGGVEFKRVQFTPDLLPSDLTGVNIFDPGERIFRFQEGPIFCQVLLADEINRTSPRTQSALLEAMAEKQVTIEGKTYPLSEDFFVIATQNPIEFRGTYPLPEAQMDRFGLQCSLGYLSSKEEKSLLDDHFSFPETERGQEGSISGEELSLIRKAVREIHISDRIKEYVVRLVASTRDNPEVQLALSPRATITLVSLAQALSFFRGEDYVGVNPVRELAPAVLAHRLVLTSPSQNTTAGKQDFITSLVEKTEVPG